MLHVLALFGLFRLLLFACKRGNRQKMIVFLRKCGFFCLGMMAPMLAQVPVQMGLLIGIGTILFGLTVSVFTSSLMTSFWVVTVAVMLALSRLEEANNHFGKA